MNVYWNEHGMLGFGMYQLKFTIKNHVHAMDGCSLAHGKDMVSFRPNLLPSFHFKVDGRRKKNFRFDQYTDLTSLAEDIERYLRDTFQNYTKLHESYTNQAGTTKKVKRGIKRKFRCLPDPLLRKYRIY